ncbi:hypothetical protein HYU12_02960 [Candidatus Woesearchaeota archaeon]|nr:hypothetical protein [Candidatus Woesearchaeota archaeon]
MGQGYSIQSYDSSGLERIVCEYATQPMQQPTYAGTGYSSGYANSAAETQPAIFLNPARAPTPFIGQAAEVEQPVKEAFRKTTGQELPCDITITVAAREELIRKNMAFLNNSVAGLSIHSTREIFATAGSMDEVMLTIGHELGHVIKKPARTAEEEEAKAFAFEAAWAKTIFEEDIAGLKGSINASMLEPAQNGLHDTAFNFVKNNSESALELFNKISNGEITQEQVMQGQRLMQPYRHSAGKTKLYGFYPNRSRIENLPPMHNFFWADLGRGVYGMYIPMTTVEMINEKLLRQDIEQLHKTLGHEYSLHHVMKLPDGYVTEALEEAMFWTKEEEEPYKP